MIPELRSPAGTGTGPSFGRHDVAAVSCGLIVPLLVFAALTFEVTHGRSLPWDASVLRFAERHYRGPVVTKLDVALKISLGLGIAVAVVALGLAVVGKDRVRAVFWALAVGGVLVLDLPLKDTIHRPSLEGQGYSFPSGNAMASVAVLAALVLTSSGRRRGWIAGVGVPAVAAYSVALVYAWWHYPSDIVGGWCVALAWVSGVWLVLRRRMR